VDRATIKSALTPDKGRRLAAGPHCRVMAELAIVIADWAVVRAVQITRSAMVAALMAQSRGGGRMSRPGHCGAAGGWRCGDNIAAQWLAAAVLVLIGSGWAVLARSLGLYFTQTPARG